MLIWYVLKNDSTMTVCSVLLIVSCETFAFFGAGAAVAPFPGAVDAAGGGDNELLFGIRKPQPGCMHGAAEAARRHLDLLAARRLLSALLRRVSFLLLLGALPRGAPRGDVARTQLELNDLFVALQHGLHIRCRVIISLPGVGGGGTRRRTA